MNQSSGSGTSSTKMNSLLFQTRKIKGFDFGEKKVLIFQQNHSPVDGYKYFCNLCNEKLLNEEELEKHVHNSKHQLNIAQPQVEYQKWMRESVINDEQSSDFDELGKMMTKKCKISRVRFNPIVTVSPLQFNPKLLNAPKKKMRFTNHRFRLQKENIVFQNNKKKKQYGNRYSAADYIDLDSDLDSDTSFNLSAPKLKLSKSYVESVKGFDALEEPKPNLMTLVRQLTTLSDYITEEQKLMVNKLFAKTNELERENGEGASNKLLSNSEVFNFLTSMRASLEKNNFEAVPEKFLSVLKVYIRDLDYLVKNAGVAAK